MYIHVYTMYIHCIYMVYTYNIPWICRSHCIYNVYTMYIYGIYRYIHSIFFEHVDVTVYIMYIHCICMVYTMNILWICRCQAYPLDIPSLYLMGLFRTFFFYNDMPKIYQVHSICLWYTKYIEWMYLAYHRHIIIKKVWNKPIRYRLGISKGYAWHLHIHGIYYEYTRYILCI